MPGPGRNDSLACPKPVGKSPAGNLFPFEIRRDVDIGGANELGELLKVNETI